MPKTFLYHQIADAIRQKILQQSLHPGDRLPSVRELAREWGCTIGTAQRAYEELARQGLVVSRPGQGTHVTAAPPVAQAAPLRRAALVHRAEAFLLETLASGYSLPEIEQAVRLAMDRWRAESHAGVTWMEQVINFVGSHDPAVAFIASHFDSIAPDCVPRLTFTGSLGGLIALARGQADMAGVHLWDQETRTYNVPFVRRFLPGQRVALVTLAHRRLGLITAPANPHGIAGLADLRKPGLRFINRPPGAGTRVWLDAQLQQLGASPEQINGYDTEAKTHSETAQTIAEGRADVGLGVEYVALVYGLGFIPLTTERYDLVIPADAWSRPAIQSLVKWLKSDTARREISALGGYDVRDTGRVAWVA